MTIPIGSISRRICRSSSVDGFGHIRVSMAFIYEIIRQERRGLVMACKTAVHDIDLLIGAGCVSKVECAYAFGHELRGLSPAGRRAVESGKVKVVAEISNAACHVISSEAIAGDILMISG